MFDKCIRYFIDFQNCITTEKNFQNVQALDRKILYYSRFEAYIYLFYISICISTLPTQHTPFIAKYIDQSGAGGISAITGSFQYG